MSRLPIAAVAAASLSAAVLAGGAVASDLIDRNATGVELQVNAKGEALLTYRAGGETKNVLAWGAVNAIMPTQTREQVKFTLDYAGGWKKYRRNVATTFQNRCAAYDGPALQWLVTACKAPDGSYWALQSWQRMLPNYGVKPSAEEAAWELRLSHWTGPLPVLEVTTNWAYRRYDHIFGRFTYLGQPVHGFRSTSSGRPLDTFGRNLYVDTYSSVYGSGWRRENSFLTHTDTGAFCYGLFEHQNGSDRPAGNGQKYRATVIGPGVTPDVMWQGEAPGTYDKSLDLQQNDLIRTLDDTQCKAN